MNAESIDFTINYFAVDGGYTLWSDWSVCSVTCGGGLQNRSRTCTNPVPQYGGATCSGDSGEIQDCNTHNCPSEFLEYM